MFSVSTSTKKPSLKPALSCVALMVSFACTQVSAEMAFSGNIELDTDIVTNAGGAAVDNYDQGGRVKLEASGETAVGTATLKGVGQLLITKDGTTGVDDAWFRLGRDTWGVKFGRFEAMETFSKGTDTVLNVIGGAANYQGNAARGRTGADLGQIALDFAASDTVSLELGTFWGDASTTDDENMVSAIRPAITMDVTDDLRVSASFESMESGGVDTDGFGLYVRYATEKFALKMNAAQGEQKTGGTTNWDNTTFNVNIESGNIGIGFHSTEDDDGDSASTVYGRYLFPNLFGSENTNAQLGLSLASADSADEDETALRLRFFHTF